VRPANNAMNTGTDDLPTPTESGGAANANSINLNDVYSNDQYARNGIMSHQGPNHPEFASVDVRRMSFKSWPRDCPVRPEQLAEAGFFCINHLDYVKCFYCSGGLCNWEEGDEPFAEHARLYPTCQFILLNQDDRPKCSPNLYGDKVTIRVDNTTDDVVENWMASDLVMKLKDAHQFSTKVMRDVLRQRYLDGKGPFDKYEELFAAVNEASRQTPSSESGIGSGESGSHAESDEETPLSQGSTLSTSPSVSYSSSGEEDRPESRVMCKICMDREVGMVFLPCGHLVACTRCGPGLTKCPYCRVHIAGHVRTFLA